MRRTAASGFAGVFLLLSSGGSVATAAGSHGGWAVGVEAALPANALASYPDVSIASVSCGSAGNCSAVGSYFESSHHYQGLLLDAVDGIWQTGVEAALPPNAGVANGGARLGSIFCPSAGNCTAIGTYTDSSGNTEGVLLTETAGVWEAGVEAVLPANADATGQNVQLSSVSCASPANCSAVGIYSAGDAGFEGLLLTEAAGVWEAGVEAVLPANADATGQNVQLSSVSCASAANCSAVGIYDLQEGQGMSTTSRGLLLTEKDGSWGTGVEPVLPPSGASDSVWLTSVSCASAGNCSAVGGYADNAGHEGLLLSETAGTWRTGVKAALPPHVDHLNYVSLNSVSCPSAGNCTTGSYQQGADSIVLLTERGGKWAPGVEAAVPARDAPVFSCPSVGNCGAIASDGSGSGLLLTETAGRWATAVDASLPSNASGLAGLTSVSCASAGYCSAVGSYEDTSGVWQGLLLSSTPVSLKPCRVPRLEGKTLTAARRSIKSHHCSVGRIRHATSRKVTRRHVISQKPKPGERLKNGAKVSLVISKGPKSVS